MSYGAVTGTSGANDRDGEDVQKAESGTVAEWTARVVREVGDDHALPDACHGARRLFALPALAATGDALPCADSSFDVAWALGVLCTTSAKRPLLRELHRVLRPGGQLGLLVLVQVTPTLPEQPEGNTFPRQDELEGLLQDTGFTIVAEADTADLGPAPDSWKAREERVEPALEAAHGSDPHWIAARAREDVPGRLLDAGHIVSRLVHAER